MQAIASMTVIPTGAMLGAEIRGVDLARDLDDETFRRIEDAFSKFGVIFFRDQEITVEQQIAFAKRFGGIELNVNQQACLPDQM